MTVLLKMKFLQFVFTEFLKSALAENLNVEDIEVSSSLVRNEFYFVFKSNFCLQKAIRHLIKIFTILILDQMSNKPLLT